MLCIRRLPVFSAILFSVLSEALHIPQLHTCNMASVITFMLIVFPPTHSGFDLLLSQLDDLSLDTPDAPEILGNFMARCVADDCLPPAYIANHSEFTDTNMM